jgi:hypothetical protein
LAKAHDWSLKTEKEVLDLWQLKDDLRKEDRANLTKIIDALRELQGTFEIFKNEMKTHKKKKSGETKHHLNAKNFTKFSMMKSWAEMSFAFLKEGEYETNGEDFYYPWDVIERDKDTYVGRQFYSEHAEKSGEELGEIKATYTRNIDGDNWLCATVRIPEANFTKEYLERAENGLIKEFSTGHRFDYKKQGGQNIITKMYGDEVSSTWRGLVPGTKMLYVKRNLKPKLKVAMSAERKRKLKAKLKR